MLKGLVHLELMSFESDILRELWRRSLSLWVIVDDVITIGVISELREEVNQLKKKNNQLEESLNQVLNQSSIEEMTRLKEKNNQLEESLNQVLN